MKMHFGKYVFFGCILIVLLIIVYVYSQQQNNEINCNDCNVIIFTSEAIRPDHLGIYGYQRNTTPNIDNFFKNQIMFENDFAQAPNTLPSHMSIMTGLYPSDHKVLSLTGNVSLSPYHLTISQILKLYGYKTAAFYSGTDNMDPKFGFGRGFDEYVNGTITSHFQPLFDFIKENENSKFFVYIQSDRAHDPYTAPHPYDTMFDSNYTGKIVGNSDQFFALSNYSNLSNSDADFNKVRTLYWSFVNKSDPRDVQHLIALYDANIYRLDSFFGKFINYLDSQKLLNRTIVIFTAGHGEEFGEHGGFLHEKLYDETIHVPLLIYLPKPKHEVIGNQVGSVDLMPTILSLLGIQQSQDIDGRSLTSLIQNPNASDPNQILYSEFYIWKAVRTPEWKLIKTAGLNVSYEFFNLTNDSKEQYNLDGKGLAEENILKEKLANYEKEFNSTGIIVQQLNTSFLGYP